MAYGPKNTAYKPALLCHMNLLYWGGGGLYFVDKRRRTSVAVRCGANSLQAVALHFRHVAGESWLHLLKNPAAPGFPASARVSHLKSPLERCRNTWGLRGVAVCGGCRSYTVACHATMGHLGCSRTFVCMGLFRGIFGKTKNSVKVGLLE